jgi:hypothetical protein
MCALTRRWRAGKRRRRAMSHKRAEHKVQVIMNGFRYVAIELNATITIFRDGDKVGQALWKHDQLVLSSATLPDDVFAALEVKIKEKIDNNWDED